MWLADDTHHTLYTYTFLTSNSINNNYYTLIEILEAVPVATKLFINILESQINLIGIESNLGYVRVKPLHNNYTISIYKDLERE